MEEDRERKKGKRVVMGVREKETGGGKVFKAEEGVMKKKNLR